LPGWSWRLALLALAGGFTMGLSMSLLPPYLYAVGLSGSEYGALMAVMAFTGIASSLAAGYLSDVLGSRVVVAAGLALGSAGYLLVSLGPLHAFPLGFALLGLASGASWSAMAALVARSGGDEGIHRRFSGFFAFSTLGAAAGSFSAAAPRALSGALGLGELEAYRATLAAMSLLPALQAALALGVEEKGSLGRPPGYSAVASMLAVPGVRRMLVFNAVVGLGAAMSIHNVGYYFAAKFGVSSAEIGVVYGVEQLALAAAAYYSPRLAEALGGPLKAYLALASASVPLLVAMALSPSFSLAASIFVFRTVLMNAGYPLFEASFMKLVPRENRGVAASLMTLSFSIPAAAGRGVGGALMDLHIDLPLFATAALYAAAIAYLALGLKHLEAGASRRASSALPGGARSRLEASARRP
jgi:MFS family permease